MQHECLPLSQLYLFSVLLTIILLLHSPETLLCMAISLGGKKPLCISYPLLAAKSFCLSTIQALPFLKAESGWGEMDESHFHSLSNHFVSGKQTQSVMDALRRIYPRHEISLCLQPITSLYGTSHHMLCFCGFWEDF